LTVSVLDDPDEALHLRLRIDHMSYCGLRKIIHSTP
jgi:hypothetical protein